MGAASPAQLEELARMDQTYDEPVTYPLINEANLPPGSWRYMQDLYRKAHTAQYHRSESLRTLHAYMDGLADGLGIDRDALAVYLSERTSMT